MRQWVVLPCTVFALSACYRHHPLAPELDPGTESPSTRDVATRDASRTDALTPDAATRDASLHDASTPDAAAHDAGERDACSGSHCGVAEPAPFAQEAYVKASNTAADAAFGDAVAIDGDTLVIGAPSEDGSAQDSGAIYVFVRRGRTWSQQAYLKARNPSIDAGFGSSVAISGNTLVVGAPRERGNGRGVDGDDTNLGSAASGAAYVFVRDGEIWSQQAYLKNGAGVLISRYGTATADHFGSSVAVTGDTLVVGAPNDQSNAIGIDGDATDIGAANSGAAYVFVRSGSVWTQHAYLKSSNSQPRDFFGTSVAVTGDTIVVGAPGESSLATGVDGDDSLKTAGGSGAGYVFVRSGEVWSQQAFLKANSTRELGDEGGGDQLGTTVAVSGNTIVIGAHCERSNAIGIDGDDADSSQLCAGAAFVYARSNGRWTQQAYFKASNTNGQDRFGTSVAVSGDTVVVGAVGESSDATGINGDQTNDRASYSGAAYVFVRSGTVWTQRAYLKANNTEAGDELGSSVAVSNDAIVAAAWREDSNATGVNGDQANHDAPDSGAVYVFRRWSP